MSVSVREPLPCGRSQRAEIPLTQHRVLEDSMKRIATAISAGVLAFAISAWARTPTQTTVVGTNSYPADVRAVQRAVDNYDIVRLSGTFNFGDTGFQFDPYTGEVMGTPMGGVLINRENLTLEPDSTTGATIIGGGGPAYSAPPYGTWPVIAINAPGVKVRGLTLEGGVDGIYIMASVWPGKPVTLEGNSINTLAMGIFISGSGTDVLIQNNTLTAPWTCIQDSWTGYALDRSGTFVQRNSRLDILNNDVISSGGWDPIVIDGWYVEPSILPPNLLPPGANLADWGDNGPVTIRGNTITISNPYQQEGWCTNGIDIGVSSSGLNHSLVADNVLRGEACGGIWKYPYGHDNSIIENDLSGLTTLDWQILVTAGNTTVARNVFGRAQRARAGLMSWNFHPPFTPMPLPVQNCIFTDNDYTLAGCPGWSQGIGCIVLTSVADLVDLDWGTEVRNNLINETGKFPAGTGGPSNQVYERIVGPNPLVQDNRVVGLPANFVFDPGIGQRLKNALPPMSQDKMSLRPNMLKGLKGE